MFADDISGDEYPECWWCDPMIVQIGMTRVDDIIMMTLQATSTRIVGLYVGFVNVSNCLTLLISLERCVCVVWPLQAKTILSVR